MSKVKLGISIYSFTKEYIAGEYTFEDCVRRCVEIGVDGYEVVGTQMVPFYPYISDEFLGLVNKLDAEYGIRPICYGANTDRGLYYDRDLDEDELFVSTLRDLRSAHRLGCKVMRVQILFSPQNLARLAPYAEEYDVKVGVEIHNPLTPSSLTVQRYVEEIEKTGSKHIGLIIDFGCFADKPNVNDYYGALERGANKELLDLAVQMKYDDVPMKEAESILISKGADEHVMSSFYSMYGFMTFSRNPDFEGLKKVMPYCIHFHGKFHHITDEGNEASIPYDKILPIIDEAGFDGYIMSEYESHHTGRAFEMTKKHIEMERRILGL